MSPVMPPKWGKYGTNWGQISKVCQHHQVTYQITRLVTLNQTKDTECNLFYLLSTFHDETCPKTNTLEMEWFMFRLDVCQMSQYVF